MTKPELEALSELVKMAAADLIEHFDSVRIFVTLTDQDSEGETVTRTMSWGLGNQYASEGYVRDWLVAQEEYTRKHTREGTRSWYDEQPED
jgi:hypothetical protein